MVSKKVSKFFIITFCLTEKGKLFLYFSFQFIVFCIIATMQLQFASLLRPIKGHKAGSSREVPIPSPTDTDTYWNNLIDNLTEKILGMKHVTIKIKL